MRKQLKALSNEMAANPSIFLNRRQFLLLHKRCNHRSDGIFQILSRNLLAVSSDAAQLIFTPSSALPELASCVLTIQKSSCIFWHLL
jgi:hypothetical protein